MTRSGPRSSLPANRAGTSVAPAQRYRKADPDHVIAVAVDLFAARGYDNVTVDEIAVAAGTSRRSLFRHFRQKEEFLGRWMLRFNHQLCTAIVRQPEGLAPLDVFRRALDEVDEIGSAAAERLLVLYRITGQSAAAEAAIVSAERAWENAVVDAFRRRAAAGSRDVETSSGIAAALGFLGLRLAVTQWVSLPVAQATQPALARILDAMFAAIRQAAR